MQPATRITIIAALASRLCAEGFSVRDTDGRIHTQKEWSGRKAVVLFFVSPECPLSNTYVPEMNRVHETYAEKGVLVYAIQSGAGISPAAAAEYTKQFRFLFPMLLDDEHELALLARATVTPQAAVLSSTGEVLYLGRIDNRMEDFGARRTLITSADLRDAIDAVLSGKAVERPRTKSVGCAIQQFPGAKQ